MQDTDDDVVQPCCLAAVRGGQGGGPEGEQGAVGMEVPQGHQILQSEARHPQRGRTRGPKERRPVAPGRDQEDHRTGACREGSGKREPHEDRGRRPPDEQASPAQMPLNRSDGHPGQHHDRHGVTAVLLGVSGVVHQRRRDRDQEDSHAPGPPAERPHRQRPEDDDEDQRGQERSEPQGEPAWPEELRRCLLQEQEADWCALVRGKRVRQAGVAPVDDVERQLGFVVPERRVGEVLTEPQRQAHRGDGPRHRGRRRRQVRGPTVRGAAALRRGGRRGRLARAAPGRRRRPPSGSCLRQPAFGPLLPARHGPQQVREPVEVGHHEGARPTGSATASRSARRTTVRARSSAAATRFSPGTVKSLGMSKRSSRSSIPRLERGHHVRR